MRNEGKSLRPYQQIAFDVAALLVNIRHMFYNFRLG